MVVEGKRDEGRERRREEEHGRTKEERGQHSIAHLQDNSTSLDANKPSRESYDLPLHPSTPLVSREGVVGVERAVEGRRLTGTLHNNARVPSPSSPSFSISC